MPNCLVIPRKVSNLVLTLRTVMRIIKLKIFPVPVRLHLGYGKLIFVIISPFIAIFKNVVHCVVRLPLVFQFTYVQYCIRRGPTPCGASHVSVYEITC